MSLAKDLAALCDIWKWNSTNASLLAVFNVDLVFACHFVATRQPSTLQPYRSASGIGYAGK